MRLYNEKISAAWLYAIPFCASAAAGFMEELKVPFPEESIKTWLLYAPTAAGTALRGATRGLDGMVAGMGEGVGQLKLEESSDLEITLETAVGTGAVPGALIGTTIGAVHGVVYTGVVAAAGYGFGRLAGAALRKTL